MEKIKRPLAFISHDSRDKDIIARPIAEGLNFRRCFVWYDVYSLRIGDSLRESIENGIKEARKCILVVTKNFLNNSGWPKTEFNSIFTKEFIEKKNTILPIWCDVSQEDVYQYSPTLADRKALMWPQKDYNLETSLSEAKYIADIETLISQLHIQIIQK